MASSRCPSERDDHGQTVQCTKVFRHGGAHTSTVVLDGDDHELRWGPDGVTLGVEP